MSVRADLDVLQERSQRGDVLVKSIVVEQLAGLKVEGEQPRVAQTVITVIDRPQAILTIYRNTEDGIEQARLRCAIGKRYRSAVDVLEQLIALRSRLRMDREKHPAAGANGDIADGLGVGEYLFDNVVVE